MTYMFTLYKFVSWVLFRFYHSQNITFPCLYREVNWNTSLNSLKNVSVKLGFYSHFLLIDLLYIFPKMLHPSLGPPTLLRTSCIFYPVVPRRGWGWRMQCQGWGQRRSWTPRKGRLAPPWPPVHHLQTKKHIIQFNALNSIHRIYCIEYKAYNTMNLIYCVYFKVCQISITATL